MKKNFLKIAAMLIAAMLLVVSCSQEVAPKNEDNGLVEAKLNVAFGKAVNITADDGAKIGYKYSLTPMWEKLDGNGTIYGDVADKPIAGEYGVSEAPSSKTVMGYVTPGLWKIEVKGYLLTLDENQNYSYTEKDVLSGEATVFFGNEKSTVTVFVAPIANAEAKGNVIIQLQMQDLEDGDVIWYKLDDAENYTPISQGDVVTGTDGNDTAAHKYEKILDNISTGLHTISFKIGKADGSKFQTGGVTRSFYLIENNDVTISGSVTPAEFAQEEALISVLSLSKSATITLTGDKNTKGNYIAGGEYTAIVSGFGEDTIESNENVIDVVMAYSWYWGTNSAETVKQNGTTISDSSSEINITLPNVPGKYTLSCLATCTVTYKNVDNSTVTYIIYGDAALQEFIVEAAN